jgi:adenine phosphoribosyltransferase
MLQLAGCEIVGFCFVVELVGLAGRQKLPEGVPVLTLVEY